MLASISTLIWKNLSGKGLLFRFSASSFLNSLSGMFGGLIIIVWVTPAELGIWKSLLIIQPYVGIVQGGVLNGLNRELPYRIGKGNFVNVQGLASTAQTFTVAGCGILLLAFIAGFFISNDPMIRYSLPAVFIVAATGVYTNYLSVTYRADQEFENLANIQFFMAGVNIATLAFVYKIGYFGIPMRVAFIGLCHSFLLFLFRPLRVPLAFRLDDFYSLIKVGIPLFIVGYAISVSFTFPNTIILFSEGTETVGKFAPALAVFGLMTLLPQSIAQYVYAKMSFRLGQTGNLNTLWSQAWKSSLGSLILSLPMVVVISLLFPILVHEFFPEYTDSTNSVGLVTLAGSFFGSQMFSSAMNSMKAWKWIYAFASSRLSLAFALPYVFYLSIDGETLVKVSAGYATAGLLSFLIGMLCAYKAMHPPAGHLFTNFEA